MQVTVKVGQRGDGGGAKPEHSSQRGEEKQHTEADA
jgi:hypothetical protein